MGCILVRIEAPKDLVQGGGAGVVINHLVEDNGNVSADSLKDFRDASGGIGFFKDSVDQEYKGG